jgi:TfoX/Sxy family transcriptional regulator of competence genes
MATSETTLTRILEHIKGDNIRAAKMFGEYAIYCDDKVVILLSDDEMFLKITPASSKEFSVDAEAPPYPGAKPYYRIPNERIKDANWLTKLINAVAADLPAPKPKKPKKPK